MATPQLLHLHYETVAASTGGRDGDADDRPYALMIHGFMSSNHQWSLNTEALRRHLNLALVELWGHGSSPRPDDPDRFSLDSYLAEFEHIRAELGVDRWWIIGQSLGGALSLRYAQRYPEHLHGVIFTNSRAAFAQGRIGVSEAERLSDDGADLRLLPYHPINAKRFPEDLKAKMVAAADAMHPATLRNTVRNRESVSSRDDFGELQVPVLLVNGRWEKLFQQAVPHAQAALPSLRIVELEGGHSINVEAADGFNEAVIEFITGSR